MNINFSLLSNNSVYFFKERVLPILTAQQKKIIAIASIAFGCLAAYYIWSHFYSKIQIPKESENNEDFDSIDFQTNKSVHPKKGVDIQAKVFFSPKKEEEFLDSLQDDKEEIQTLNLNNNIYQDEVKDGKSPVRGNIGEDECKDNELNGQGKIVKSNGMIFEGEFKDGTLNGQGKIISRTGMMLEGEFKDGKLNGQGKIVESNGMIFEGEFKDGALNGQGKIIVHTEMILEGEFKDGILNGQGKIILHTGTILEGEFKNGRLNGQGTAILLKGRIEGEFKNNKLNGQGKIILFDGTKVEEGEFKDDKLNGQGKVTFSSGRVEEGEFKDDKLNGQGKVTFSSGRVEEGDFKSNKLYSSIHLQIKTSKPQFTFNSIPPIKSSLQFSDFQNSLLNLSDNLGPTSTGITESYVWYMRKLIFGFSIGQKQKLTEISSHSGIKLKKLKKILQGSTSTIQMGYIARHIDELISQLNSKKCDEIDTKYMDSLQKLQAALQCSLPIALMLHYINSNKIDDQVLEQVANDICEELDQMKPGAQLLLPIESKNHAMLLTFQKMKDDTLLPIFYNTGYGIKNHITTGLRLEDLIDHLNTKRNYYPTYIKYCPIDLKSHQMQFKTMLIDLLNLRNGTEVKKGYSILEATFGKGNKGPTRPAQINGVCSFQVLTEAFKNILGSKSIYNTYKLDLLSSIQEEFQEITDGMKLLMCENDQMKSFYKLHQILLKENQNQIDLTKQKLALIAS